MITPAALSLRNAVEADLPSVLRCDAYAQENLSRRLDLSHLVEQHSCFLAEVGGQAVGFAILEYTFFGQGFIPLICVASEHQGKGMGLSLLLELEAHCSTAKLFTSTNASNTRAQRLFVRAGYVASGNVENLDEGDPEMIYFKPICHPRQAANPSVKGSGMKPSPYVNR